jgi:DNA-directed RNA polymerase subunit F
MQQQEAEGGAGGGGQPQQIAPEVQELINKAVADATAGLKAKTAELLNEKRAVQERLKQFGDADPETVNALVQRFSNEEEAGLIKAGKIDEVLNKRTERMKGDYDKKLSEREQEIAKLNAKAQRLAAGKVSGALTAAASKAGALPEAMEDIVLRGQTSGWSVDEDGNVVAQRDGEVVLGKDGKTPLTPSEWAETLRETAPHLWPKAQGSGAPGSGSGARRGAADLSNLPPEARMNAAREGKT